MDILLLNKDLRIENNGALREISKLKTGVYAFYFLQKEHLGPNVIPSINFLKNRLALLSQKLELNIFQVDDEIKFLESIDRTTKISSIYINECFTPFAIKRKQLLLAFCKKHKIKLVITFDYLSFYPGTITKTNGNVSKTFAPFREGFLSKIKELKLSKPYALGGFKDFKHPCKVQNLEFERLQNFPTTRGQVLSAIRRQTNYKERRDQLADFHFPSKIAAAIGWGVIAFAEVILLAARTFGLDSEFLRQLIFREFYYHYYYVNRRSYLISRRRRSNILGQYDTYPWISNANDIRFQAWKQAQTGVKLIDAAMNELATTFNMKNRMRMVVASFLTKDLNVDWRLGERHFAKLLVDYDPVINNQSWQWAAGSGLDYRGASRIFSVARQQEKHDPFGFYVGKFLPRPHKQMLSYNSNQAINDWRHRRREWVAVNQSPAER